MPDFSGKRVSLRAFPRRSQRVRTCYSTSAWITFSFIQHYYFLLYSAGWQKFKNQLVMALTEIGASLIGAGIGALGSASAATISSGATTKLNKKNRKWQEKMYNIKREDSLEDYDRQLKDFLENREYNSISSQMKRAIEAGVNPMVMAGGATQQAANPGQSVASSDTPSPATYGFDFSGITSGMNTLASGLIKYSELQLDKERNDIARQNAKTELFKAYSDAMLKASQSEESSSRKVLNDIEAKYRGELLSGNIEKIKSESELNNQRSLLALEQTISESSMRKDKVNEIRQKISLMNSQIDNLMQQAILMSSQAYESDTRAGLNESNAALSRAHKEWQDFQNSMKDIYESINNSNMTKAEKEAAWYNVNTIWHNINGTLSSTFGPVMSSYMASKTSGFYQGYNPSYAY